MYTPLCIIQCFLNFMTILSIQTVEIRAVPFVKKLYHPLEVAPDVELWALAGGVSMLLLLILGSPGPGRRLRPEEVAGCPPPAVWKKSFLQKVGGGNCGIFLLAGF